MLMVSVCGIAYCTVIAPSCVVNTKKIINSVIVKLWRINCCVTLGSLHCVHVNKSINLNTIKKCIKKISFDECSVSISVSGCWHYVSYSYNDIVAVRWWSFFTGTRTQITAAVDQYNGCVGFYARQLSDMRSITFWYRVKWLHILTPFSPPCGHVILGSSVLNRIAKFW